MSKCLMKWLNKELQNDVRKLFEARYGKKMTDEDITEIAGSLVGLVENTLKSKWRQRHEKQSV